MASSARTASEEPEDDRISRRHVLKAVAIAPVGVLGASSTVRAAESPPLAPLPAATAGESVLLRMQREVQRSLKKPVEQRRWVMAVDMRRCVGCAACTVSCAVGLGGMEVSSGHDALMVPPTSASALASAPVTELDSAR